MRPNTEIGCKYFFAHFATWHQTDLRNTLPSRAVPLRMFSWLAPPKLMRISAQARRIFSFDGTSNIQHRTTNIQFIFQADALDVGGWLFGVGCFVFDFALKTLSRMTSLVFQVSAMVMASGSSAKSVSPQKPKSCSQPKSAPSAGAGAGRAAKPHTRHRRTRARRAARD